MATNIHFYKIQVTVSFPWSTWAVEVKMLSELSPNVRLNVVDTHYRNCAIKNWPLLPTKWLVRSVKATFLALNVCNLVTRLWTVSDITYQYPTNLVASSVTKFQASWHLVHCDIYKVSWAFLAFSLSSKPALQLSQGPTNTRPGRPGQAKKIAGQVFHFSKKPAGH